ncbi:Uma2 family endonuclease [Pleurocapsales cyanobacterium LEGE 10410]|nr:Uma2 family endonuclease [Pleurocapsales cyanobacterium LEGE 10410]
MIPAVKKKIYTPEEYLEFEVTSSERHEYDNGEIRLMTGGTPDHNDIAGNLYILLKQALRKKPYRVFNLEQRLWLPERNLYTYPDLMVLEQPMQLQEGRTDTVMNPCFIAEVLSKSTKDYDRSDKFIAYRTIETFQEYLLIDQYQIHVEHYVKQNANQWLLSEYSDPEVTLNLNAIALQLKIADLYEDVDLET